MPPDPHCSVFLEVKMAKSLVFYIMHASCVTRNSLHACPFVMYDICNCSSLSALPGGIVCMHVTVHLVALIIVAKVLNVIIYWNLS